MYSKVLQPTDVDRLFHLGGTAKIDVPVTSNKNLNSTGGGLQGWWTFDGKNMLQNVADSLTRAAMGTTACSPVPQRRN